MYVGINAGMHSQPQQQNLVESHPLFNFIISVNQLLLKKVNFKLTCYLDASQ